VRPHADDSYEFHDVSELSYRYRAIVPPITIAAAMVIDPVTLLCFRQSLSWVSITAQISTSKAHSVATECLSLGYQKPMAIAIIGMARPLSP